MCGYSVCIGVSEVEFADGGVLYNDKKGLLL